MSKVQSLGAGEAQDPILSTTNVNINSLGVTEIVNVTEKGKLFNVTWHITNGFSGSPTITIGVTIDGGTRRSFQFTNAGVAYDPDVNPYVTLGTAPSGAAGAGLIPFHGLEYRSSLVVDIDIDATGTGQVEVGALRGQSI